MSASGWIGVDLDGTLAVYGGWRGPGNIGEPVPVMLERVKRWLDEGQQVKIFTARAFGPDAQQQIAIVQDWLESVCKLPRLEVTCVKDFSMIELWDDRCVQVEPNTGRVIGQSTRGLK